MNLSIRPIEDKNINDDFKTYEPRLNQEWVQVLINLRMKYSKCFTRKRHSATEAWMCIYRDMVQLGAPGYISVEKIKKKWMNLIARYKHLKFSNNRHNTITWPYFEQIDRAYSRNPTIIELRKAGGFLKVESDSDEEKNSDYVAVMMKKKQFTNNLIQLRFDYRHLFTGKKYAAQKGWMVIQNKHPEGRSYTIEQLSKCWQNLVQRYRTLLENESDHSKITWAHFHTIHEKMHKREDDTMNPSEIKQDENGIKHVPNENKQAILPDSSSMPTTSNSTTCIDKINVGKIRTEIHEDKILNSEMVNQALGKMVEEMNIENDKKLFYDEENACDEVMQIDQHHNNTDIDRNDVRINVQEEMKVPSHELIQYLMKRDAKIDEQHKRIIDVLERIAKKLDDFKND